MTDTTPPPAEAAPALAETPANIATPGTAADAVHDALDWLISGATVRDVENALRKHYPDLDPSPLILAASDMIIAAGQMPPEAVRGFCIEGARTIYRKTLGIGDFANALAALKHIHNWGCR